ncbi:MAG: DUF5995 family protein [Ornithinibacter sp.]
MAATVQDRLATLSHGWERSGDRRAIFAQCYLIMTARVREAIAAGEFVDGVWVTRLLDRFADYYFDAIDAHAIPDAPVPCPPVWVRAFDACTDPGCHPLRALLLGINAHINHDLALAIVDVLQDWADLDDVARETRRADHEHVNTIIEATTDEVQRDVVARWAPGTAILDLVLGPLDEWVFGVAVESFRGNVWVDAMTVMALPTDGRGPTLIAIGRRADEVADVLTFGRGRS